MVKLHKSGGIKFLHKNLWGILLICTKKPQENREGSGRTLKKLDNSSRCARMRQGKGGNGLVKTFWNVGIMVKVPISTGKMPDSHQIPGRKRPFHWWILPNFPLRNEKKRWETALGFPPKHAFYKNFTKSVQVK